MNLTRTLHNPNLCQYVDYHHHPRRLSCKHLLDSFQDKVIFQCYNSGSYYVCVLLPAYS